MKYLLILIILLYPACTTESYCDEQAMIRLQSPITKVVHSNRYIKYTDKDGYILSCQLKEIRPMSLKFKTRPIILKEK